MATTYYSPQTKAGYGKQPRTPLGICSISGAFNIATDGAGTAFVINDVIQMVKIPAGATVLDVIFDCPDLDSSTGVRTSVGDGDSPARYNAISNVGVAGGIERMNVAGGSQNKYSADDTIDVKVTTAATGTAATTGTLMLTVLYTLDP